MTVQQAEISYAPQKLELDAQLKFYSQRISELVEKAKKFEIKTQNDAESAITFACEARTLCKKIDSIRKDITEPARGFISKINDTAKKFTEQLDKIEVEMLLKVDYWKDLERDKREVFDLLEYTPSSDIPQTIRTDNATAYEKTYWEFSVVDIEKVPGIYLEVNAKQVEHMLNLGVQNIPGIKFWKKTKTILRSK